MSILPLLLVVLGTQLPDTLRAPVISRETMARADSLAAAEFARDSLGSVTVGIVAGAELVWSRSYGFEDRARRRAATPATVYRVASVTKQVTALMLLQLVERKRVRFGDPVERWYALDRIRVRPARGGPTLLQLATMTSGLARDPDDRRRSQAGAPSQWEQQLRSGLAHTTFAAEPGAAYRYSNIGYAVLGAALARAAGTSYEAYVEAHVLRPLGMRSSGFARDARLGSFAEGVDYDELYRDTLNYQDAADEHRTGLGFRLPGGGLYSTVGDLARLVSLQLGFGPPGVLSDSMRRVAHRTPVVSTPSLDYGYGLGIQVYRWGDTTGVGHSGNLAGYTAQILRHPDRAFGVIVLRSAAGGHASAGRLAGQVYRMIARETAPQFR